MESAIRESRFIIQGCEMGLFPKVDRQCRGLIQGKNISKIEQNDDQHTAFFQKIGLRKITKKKTTKYQKGFFSPNFRDMFIIQL